MKTTKLKKMNACPDAVEWASEQKNQQQAWNDCSRGDWMLWLLGKLSEKPESKSRKKLVLTACQCARLSLKHVSKGELRPLIAIETAEKWANNDPSITLEAVKRAAADAADAYADAYAATYAARAAYAAARYAAYAAAATYADAAAAATYADADADAAAEAAAYAAYRCMADKLVELIEAAITQKEGE